MHKNVNCILPLLTVWGSQAPPYCKLGMRARTARHTQTQTIWKSLCKQTLVQWSPSASFSGLSSLSSPSVSSQAVSDNSFPPSAFQEGMSLFPGNWVQGQVCGTRRDQLLPRPWLPILEMASQVSCLIWMCLRLTDQKPPSPTSGGGGRLQIRHLDCPCHLHL